MCILSLQQLEQSQCERAIIHVQDCLAAFPHSISLQLDCWQQAHGYIAQLVDAAGMPQRTISDEGSCDPDSQGLEAQRASPHSDHARMPLLSDHEGAGSERGQTAGRSPQALDTPLSGDVSPYDMAALQDAAGKAAAAALSSQKQSACAAGQGGHCMQDPALAGERGAGAETRRYTDPAQPSGRGEAPSGSGQHVPARCASTYACASYARICWRFGVDVHHAETPY